MRLCKLCGEPLSEDAYRTAVYHPACRDKRLREQKKLYNRTARAAKKPKKSCHWCGVQHSRRSPYCSDECRDEFVGCADDRKSPRDVLEALKAKHAREDAYEAAQGDQAAARAIARTEALTGAARATRQATGGSWDVIG